MSFETALAFTLLQEGGYVNNPHDRGGPTNAGVTQRTYDAWQAAHNFVPRDVKEITPAEVAEIYQSSYWHPAGCDRLPEKLAGLHFDAAVNHGCGRAVKFLQQSVGAAADGSLGPLTLAAVERAVQDVGEIGVCQLYLVQREQFYKRLIERDPTQQVFARGWQKRVDSLRASLA
jgi:lysozyme family protein